MNKDINNLQKLYEATQEQSITIKNWQRIPKNYTGRVEFNNGTRWWFKDGKRHREDGPAAIGADGNHSYWLNNECYTREDYYRELHKRGIISDGELFAELL